MDPDGSVDFGNFDSLTVRADDYLLIGEFGAVKISGGAITLEVDEQP